MLNLSRHSHVLPECKCTSLSFSGQALPEFRWCAHAGCGAGQLHDGGDAAPVLRCGKCRQRTCFTHRCVWHDGRTCKQYDADARASEEVAQLQALEGVVRCPGCGSGVEKKGGCCRRLTAVLSPLTPLPPFDHFLISVWLLLYRCDHMTCRCGHEFCWRCLASYGGPDGIWKVGNRAHKPTCQFHM